MKLKLFLSSGIIIAILSGILFINSGIYSISSDESSRTLISYYWFTSGKLQSTSWLPLHFILLGLGFNLSNNLILLPRMISILFGILTIVSVVLLTKEIFDSLKITLISLLIILLIPQRVILSIVPLPEIIFFFLITTGALFFFKWLKYEKVTHLIIASLFILVSGSIRYEGWIFSGSLFLYLLFRYKNFKIKIPLLILLLSFPLFWLGFNYLKYNDFLYFLNEPVNYYAHAQEETLFNTIIFNPFVQFLEQGFINLNILGLYGIYLLRKNTFIKKWLFVFFIPLLIFSIIALSGKGLPAHNFWRTSAVWIILLIPFTALVIRNVIKKLSFLRTGIILAVLFFLQMLNSNNYYLKNINEDICFTEVEMNTASNIMNYIDDNALKDDMILIENRSNFDHLDISLASEHPFRFVASERGKLIPYRMYNTSSLKINYYLLKSDSLKNMLLNDSDYKKVLLVNGWMLFGRKEPKFSKQQRQNDLKNSSGIYR